MRPDHLAAQFRDLGVVLVQFARQLRRLHAFQPKPSPFSSERITTLQDRGPSRTFENQLHLITLATQDMTLIDHRLQNGGLFTFCRFYRASVSVTSRSSTKTAKRRITQTTPHDSPGTLVF